MKKFLSIFFLRGLVAASFGPPVLAIIYWILGATGAVESLSPGKVALGILTITPSEGAIIGADTATKAANVEVIFVDRFNGSLVIGGSVADVEASVKDVLRVLENLLHFTPTQITRT